MNEFFKVPTTTFERASGVLSKEKKKEMKYDKV